MTRRLFTLAALLSLLICATTAAAWAWSSVIQPLQIAWGNPTAATRYTLCVGMGRLFIQEDWAVRPTPLTAEQEADYDAFQLHHGVAFDRLGLELQRGILGTMNGSNVSGMYQKRTRFSVALFWPLFITLPLALLFVHPTASPNRSC